MLFSIIIPVYNRPLEIKELLESLNQQSFRDFEVIIVEDGSSVTCKEICGSFAQYFPITYYFQKNSGQGFARNFGMKQASGDFFVLLDSDCIAPPNYLKIVAESLELRQLDAFGGPDAAEENFSPLQKAINFSMTSLFTTGGIRGKLPDPSKYQARGYNMGLSRKAFEETQGFVDPNKGEDIELSIRLQKLGFKLELIADAFVYHKRRNTFWSFIKQSYSFGKNRVNVSRFHPEAIKIVHLLPFFFLLGVFSLPGLFLFRENLFYLGVGLLGLWSLGLMITSTIENKSLFIGLLSLPVAFGQLLAYGAGLASESLRKASKG
ncbi:glycosyltransferase [Litoribacter alkaliphilus]|uniref:Glycosyltransferase n=1 Tax=Litoribacter ruber TaxID=702568 RepID=A0AAP2CHX4_9BACT|nr:glycosyltransferase [Litoribacter alkaliphilus]MBS9525028.1 glycosyltransferase [Litoribacter alkaliphilus]